MRVSPPFLKLLRGLMLAVLCGLAACAQKAEPLKETLDIAATSFQEIDGWGADQQKEALPAFLKSCSVLKKKEPDYRLGLEAAGTAADWQAPCEALRQTPLETDAEARAFFERYFTPYRVKNEQKGLFTGYYEAQLKGSWTQGGAYQTPLWERPDDMLSVELGAFRDSWKGEKITGKIEGRRFVPYDDRARIAAGSLAGRAKPLVWVEDPIGAFFMEIQGSGQIKLPDAGVIRVGYDAQNGHGYTPIGRVLADRGEIEKPVTMQKIRAWLKQNPSRAQDIMNTNPSVVFFRKVEKEGAVGAQGVVLTPRRSLAVDRSFVPLGVPVWLASQTHKQLVVAQDTGGAIKGPVRGDLFLGAGPQAEDEAGKMQESGTYVLLLPKKAGAAHE